MNRIWFRSNVLLIFLGVGMGLVARSALGPPESKTPFPRRFSEPLSSELLQRTESEGASGLDLDFDSRELDAKESTSPESDESDSKAATDSKYSSGGWVPAVRVDRPSMSVADPERIGFSRYEHGPGAIFEPHGNQVCASGCALSRHPTQALTPSHFKELIDRYARGPMNDQNEALEELLYFGPQTRRQIAQSDRFDLDAARLEFLNRQLDVTHGTVAIRLVDSEGRIRSWLPPTRVPLDRRHVFDMRTADLPSLVTSGTIKRVGLNHVWSRL